VKIFFSGAGAVNYFVDYDNSTDFLKSRRKFVSQIGLGIAAVPFFIFDLWDPVGNTLQVKATILFQIYQRHLMVLPSSNLRFTQWKF
jgi:hypothetical protein